MKRILVTGANGFIGRHCLPLLTAKGYEVHAVYSSKPDVDASNVKWHKADLLEPLVVSRLMGDVQPTHLLHLAWVATPGIFWNSLTNLRWVRASLDLLESFALNGGKRVVMSGSCAEYDWKYGDLVEGVTPLAPGTLYGAAKHALQSILEQFATQTGISAAWGRLFLLYGPYEHPDRLVAYVVRSLLRGEAAHCSHGNQVRDFLYVGDAASAFVALLESDVSGAVNIASGEALTLKEMILKIADQLGGHNLIRWGSVKTAVNEPERLVADVQRLRNNVGWSPEWGLEKGLKETISWWQTHCDDDPRDGCSQG